MARKNRIDIVLFTRYRTENFPDSIFTRMKEVFESTCLEMGCRVLRFRKETDYIQLRVKKPDSVESEVIIDQLKSIDDEGWSEIKSFWGNHYVFASKIKAS